MKISVSYLGQKNIASVISELDKTDADFIHVDVMDGKYVKNKTLSFSEMSDIGYFTKKRLDVHFMVQKPLKYIDDYAELNASYMTFHLDTKDKMDDIITRCKMYGIKVGIALNPNDSIDLVEPYLDKINLVLIMGVKPGLPNQKLIEEVIPKINSLRKIIKEKKLNVLLSIDGGVNLENRDKLNNCDVLVSGSFITNSNDYQEAITSLRKAK